MTLADAYVDTSRLLQLPVHEQDADLAANMVQRPEACLEARAHVHRPARARRLRLSAWLGGAFEAAIAPLPFRGRDRRHASTLHARSAFSALQDPRPHLHRVASRSAATLGAPAVQTGESRHWPACRESTTTWTPSSSGGTPRRELVPPLRLRSRTEVTMPQSRLAASAFRSAPRNRRSA